jgi:hypothetical protein
MEAGTFDGTYVHRPVTGGADRDHAPTLALGAGPTPTAHLVWVRDGDLWSAVADRPGSWRQLRRLGGPGQHPDLVADEGVLHLVWHRAGAVWYGRGSPARMTAERVAPTRGFDSARLAVSKGQTSIVFEGSSQGGPPTMLVSRHASSPRWRTAALWRLWDVHRFAITAVDGRATVLIGGWRSGAVRLRSQER